MSQTQVQRVDPRPRSVDGYVEGRVLNQRPDRQYVLANPNDDATGVAFYEAMGYQFVRESVDKERLAGGRKQSDASDVISKHGQLLMWCPIEEHRAREALKGDLVARRERKAAGPGGIDDVVGPLGRPAEPIVSSKNQ